MVARLQEGRARGSEGGRGRLPSPGDQWGFRCCGQSALPSQAGPWRVGGSLWNEVSGKGFPGKGNRWSGLQVTGARVWLGDTRQRRWNSIWKVVGAEVEEPVVTGIFCFWSKRRCP